VIPNAHSRQAPEGVLHRAPVPIPVETQLPRVTPQARPTTPALPAPRSARWTVRPGDNLWSIASAVVSARIGRQGSDLQVAAYWVDLIQANQSRLPVPSDPSLIFPGDVIELPPFGDTPAP
jgi:hypothetical protein